MQSPPEVEPGAPPGPGGDDVLARFHPLVAGWFREQVGAPTAPQRDGWPAIAAGRDTLIAAPTGSGKTLAAFLACLDRLVVEGLQAPLADGIRVLYVSPLKALSNDVQKNLERPLGELAGRAAQGGVRFPDIRVAVRTGDTPAGVREKLAKQPPHILVTTPESLYILLTSGRGRASLAAVDTVIVDEIHAIAGDKRGAHLALSLERLDRLVTGGGRPPPVRVGLSATQRPIERVASLLVGSRRPPPVVVDSGHRRALDLAIEITDDELGAVATNEQLGRVYDRIAELVGEHQTTLVFVNTRRLVEKVAHHLEERLGEDQVVAHHGSMSRERRLLAEDKLKAGTVKCAVATASLELGIDVGAVDLVVQLGSPRSLATFLQRVGRSGHSLGGTPKGRLFALTRDQLLECAALVRGVRRGNLDELCVRDAPLDILAQQMVATCAAEDDVGEDELYELVTGAAPYAALTRARFDELVTMLSEGVSDRRRIGLLLHRDGVARRLKGRRGARLLAITSGGAIPDNANYAVVEHPGGTRVGEVDEDFAIDSMAGDVFLLGNTAWKIHRIETGRVFVEDARGQPPSIPFWLGEAPARTRELSDEVSDLRAELDRRLGDGAPWGTIAAWLVAETSMSRLAAEQLVAYLAAGRAVLGALPRKDLLIAERFFDEGGGMQLVIHAPLGGRLNRAWGLALRKRFCRGFNFELQAAATDDGIVISLGQPHSFPLTEVFGFLASTKAEPLLVQAVLDQPAFEVRWRWNATRSLTVARRMGGKKIAPHLVRMRAADLLSVVFPHAQACPETLTGDREIPDHPLVFETLRDCLVEAMDGAGLTALCAAIERGEIAVMGKDTVEPSPLCHELLNANPYAFLDDAPLEERRTRAVNLRRGLPPELAETAGALAPEAIAAAEDEAAPPVRDLDELHDVLLTRWLVPVDRALALAPAAPAWLRTLAAAGRATRLTWTDAAGATACAWVCAERLAPVRAALPSPAVAEPDIAAVSVAEPGGRVPGAAVAEPLDPTLAVRRIVAAQLDVSGPRTIVRLARDLGLAPAAVEEAVLALEADGDVLRGAFTTGGGRGQATTLATVREGVASDELCGRLEWCNRRILARIHRLTLARLRREIEPVDAATLVRFLLRWQRVARGTQLIGAEGLARIIEQLAGFETAAGAWERELLPARLHGYDASWLDQLCLAGEVAWARLSPRKPVAADDEASAESSGPTRVTPSRAAPLSLFRRVDGGWLRAPIALRDAPAPELSAEATAIAALLREGGAAFLADLVAGSALSPDAIEDALWELVGAGLAAADGFASLRVLIERKRGEVKSRFDAPRAATDTADPTHAWREAVRRARGRDRERPARAIRSLPTAAGRWSLLGAPRAEAIDAERSARQLLARYGVVFRDLVAREAALPPWRDLAMALRRLEARGELRGGRFVHGFVGEQFALPEALDELRGLRAAPAVPELCKVAATDPLNLVGIVTPGARVPAVIGNAVLYRDGVPIASREAGQLVVRVALEPGASIDDDLTYHPPPRRAATTAQVALPL